MHFQRFLWALLLVLNTHLLLAQSEVIQYHFKAGQVLDFLLLNQNPQSDSLAKIYFKTAIPIAIKNGYTPKKGFKVNDFPLQGNYHPQNIVLATWPSASKRAACLTELVEQIPDFHFQRRAIWTNFNVLFYELEKDLSFRIDKNQYNVMTTYWQVDGQNMDTFLADWTNALAQTGGQIIVQFPKGNSTFGYRYLPDHLLICSWPTQAAYEDFVKRSKKMDQQSIAHINQFHLQ